MGRKAGVWYRFVRKFVRVFYFKFSGGLRVRGLENVPLEGPLIVAPNHVSNLDPPAIACSLNRPVTFMAKEELFRVPIFGPLIRSLDAFPVKRGAADMEAIRLAFRLLGEGRALLVFPEGTRGDGKALLPFNRGVAMLAKRSSAPVLPVGIVGTHRKLPRGRSFPRHGRTTVTYGKPLNYADFADAGGEGEVRDAFSKALERSLIALCAEGGLELKTGESSSEPKSSDLADEAIESTPRG